MANQQVATPPAPIVDLVDLREIAPGVWLVPDLKVPLVPNIGIIEGKRLLLVVDTGMGPKNAENVLRKAQEIADGRGIILTATHFHPEHAFGAQVFAGKAIVAYNRSQRDELRTKGPSYIDMFKGFGPGIAECLEGVELIDPDIVYDGHMTIDLGGKEVDLIEVGPAHTRGDQLVWLPNERIVFAGDLLETRVFPIFPYFPPDDIDVDGNKWISVLRRISGLEPRTVVTGHCETGDLELVRTVENYLVSMGERVSVLKRNGKELAEILDVLGPTIRSEHPDWREPEWVDFGIRSFYATGFGPEVAGEPR